MKTNTQPQNTDPMEEAYKQLDGEPSMTAVSDAAQGRTPTNAAEQNDINVKAKMQRLYGTDNVEGCDIEDAYAKIFEGLAAIIRNK